jgi:hypothetical protein
MEFPLLSTAELERRVSNLERRLCGIDAPDYENMESYRRVYGNYQMYKRALKAREKNEPGRS